MKVKVLIAFGHGKETFQPEQEIEVDNAYGKVLLNAKLAKEIKERKTKKTEE